MEDVAEPRVQFGVQVVLVTSFGFLHVNGKACDTPIKIALASCIAC